MYDNQDLFQKWWADRLTIGSYPAISYLQASGFDVVINVSDTSLLPETIKAAAKGIIWTWFPMGEDRGSMGLQAIYGALYTLKECEALNKKVYLHCHAGKNRSQTVGALYHLFRTGKLPKPSDHPASLTRLEQNIQMEILPPMDDIHKFLRKLDIVLNSLFLYDIAKAQIFLGGHLDWLLDPLGEESDISG